MGVSVAQPWIKKNTTVAAQSTKIVDSIPVAKFSRAEYVVSYKNAINDKKKSLKLSAEIQGSEVFDSVYARLGDLDVGINTLITGSNMELKVTNNELFLIDVKFARLRL